MSGWSVIVSHAHTGNKTSVKLHLNDQIVLRTDGEKLPKP